ncbi:adenosine receptor A2a-like [Porites lutea]|uniref:adenosine receptor A2a-like n=1 Tax=Porites lutea TaxID=51062 RepID=UPI003CC6723D
MSKAEIVILCGAIFQGLCIFLGNFITVFVFWMHRHKLKRTSFLLINLSVTDLLVGLTQIAMVGAIAFPRTTGVRKVSNKYSPDISTCFQAAFSTASVFFLALISLERAFALMWPLRAIILVWTAAMTVGASCLLAVYGILKYRYYMALLSIVIILSLVIVSLSYLAIRTKLTHQGPAINTGHNRQDNERNAKLSRTLFIVIGASVIFWFPGLVVYLISLFFTPGQHSTIFIFLFSTMLHVTNSLVNPVIYSLRMPVFREAFKRVKKKVRIRRQHKTYTVYYKSSKVET